MKGEYSTKNPRLREYRNAALDLLKTFKKYELTFIHRAQNRLANDVSFAASNCQIPHVNEQFIVKVKNRPIVLGNVDYWQVFEGDKKIDDFLQSKNEFEIPETRLGHEEYYFAKKRNPQNRVVLYY